MKDGKLLAAACEDKQVRLWNAENGAAAAKPLLAGFTAAQRELIDPAVAKAAQAVVTWIESGIDAAMNKFNQSEAG